MRTQLSNILSSSAFAHGERAARLLSFLVEHALRGDSNGPSERDLAIGVFNRKANFDPAQDAIARVEVSRLRKRLRAYYGDEGAQAPVLIEIPPRGYAPTCVFRPVETGTPSGSPASKAVWTWRHEAIAGSLLVLIVLAAWGFIRMFPRSAGTAQRSAPGPSIAVLPFRDLANDQDQEYFCEGLTEELIESLTKVDGLRVASKTSALHFKGKTDDVRRIGQQLGVRLILEGSVRRDPTTVRVIAELIEASSGYHLWSQAFQRDIKDVFAIQTDIARAVAARLQNQLAGQRWLRPLDEGAPSPAAYSLYLRGLKGARKATPDGLGQAIEAFQQALRIDPQYAAAHAELGACYATLAVQCETEPRAAMEKARAAATRALQLDPNLPDAHATLGLVKGLYDWDWPAAKKALQHAHNLDPTDPSVHEAWIMGYLVPKGRLDEAKAEAAALQSFDPLSPKVSELLGAIHFFRRQYQVAALHFRKSIELDPGFAPGYFGLGSAQAHHAAAAEAVSNFRRGLNIAPSVIGMSLLAQAHAGMRDEAEVRKLMEALSRKVAQGYVPPVQMALIEAGRGDKASALAWLERAFQARCPQLAYLVVNPQFDAIRSDPGFVSLVSKVHRD